MKYKSNCDSYSDELWNISVNEHRRYISVSEVEIWDSGSDNSVDVKDPQEEKWKIQIYHTAQYI
jgi:hypothetical protein